jgi:hypothetical protein
MDKIFSALDTLNKDDDDMRDLKKYGIDSQEEEVEGAI